MAKTLQRQPNLQQKKIAVFDNLETAQAAKEKLQNSDVTFERLSIDGEITPYEEVAAMGTTVGLEAGILIGAFFGGTLGVIFVAILSTQLYGTVTSSTMNQLLIACFTAAGILLGAIAGRNVRNAHLSEQKQKGNPDVPRNFGLLVTGSSDAIHRAEEILGYSAG